MQLSKHIAQGKLLYLNQGDEAISISENEHYRWLAFTSKTGEAIIQSVMHQRKPWLLTLPHQTLLMLPLLYFRPENIVELGLGGGNLNRFLSQLSPRINMQSIEQSEAVIACFERYFNPQKSAGQLLHDDSQQWLAAPKEHKPDWLICDVYKTQNQSVQQTNAQLAALIDNITKESCLSINLPDANDDEVNLCLTVLQQLQSSHTIYYFHVPNYLNIVIQLIPKHWQTIKLLKRNQHSYLPKRLFLQWRKFWRHGYEVRLK